MVEGRSLVAPIGPDDREWHKQAPQLEEAGDGPVRGTYENVAVVINELEAAGVEFTDGAEPGVKLKARKGKRHT